MPVVDYYRKQGKVVDVSLSLSLSSSSFLSREWKLTEAISIPVRNVPLQIDSSKSIDAVFADIEKGIAPILA